MSMDVQSSLTKTEAVILKYLRIGWPMMTLFEKPFFATLKYTFRIIFMSLPSAKVNAYILHGCGVHYLQS